MNQDRKREPDMPDRQSNMEQGEGSRERGRGAGGERNRASNERAHGNSGGITNRPLDQERCEQEHLPERGQSESER